jgi:diketogulonate reductase-like aldo/keto reductase
MRTATFGKEGPAVPVIGQGTWYIDEARHDDAVKALQHGLDLGLTHIDTAEMYGSGAAEEVIADAIIRRRDEVFLVSKVLPYNASRQGTIDACQESLARLRTDHLDCYLIHWRGRHPLEDTFEALEDLKAAGKIKSYGVSNFDVDDLEESYAIVGDGNLACNQVLYHLDQRAIEHAVLPWCADHGVVLVAYSPFGHDAFPCPRSRGWETLQTIALKHSATERQIALAFLTRDPGVLTIPKASKLDHVTENAGAGLITLDDDDVAALDAAFPKGRKPGHLPML